jgi:hypothetical protein
MSDFLVSPLIAGNNRDSESLNIIGLEHHENGLLVAGCGPHRILIDDCLSPGLSRQKRNGKQAGEQD